MNGKDQVTRNTRPNRAFFIDSENGIKSLTSGYQFLTSEDQMIIFHRNSFPKRLRKQLESCAAPIEWIHCVDPGVKNSMDVQIIAEFSARLNDNRFKDGYIVSCDQGYKPAIHYLQRKTSPYEHRLSLVSTIGNAVEEYATLALQSLVEVSTLQETKNALAAFLGEAGAVTLMSHLATLFIAEASKASSMVSILDFNELGMNNDKQLIDMKGIGPSLATKLEAAGITTPSSLKRIGATEAWKLIREQDESFSIRWLYTFEAAIEDCSLSEIESGRRQALKEAALLLAS